MKKDLYSVTLNKDQIQRALEAYVIGATHTVGVIGSGIRLVAKAELPVQLTEVIVRVSERRASPKKAAA